MRESGDEAIHYMFSCSLNTRLLLAIKICTMLIIGKDRRVAVSHMHACGYVHWLYRFNDLFLEM